MLWTQPEDSQIFASFRDDVPASSSLFGASTTRGVEAGVGRRRPTSTGRHTLSTSPTPVRQPAAQPR